METRIENKKHHKFEWIQVLRFDNAHGYPHMDKLDKSGNEIETIKFEYLTNKEALTMSVDLIKSNYKEFIQIFLENKGDK